MQSHLLITVLLPVLLPGERDVPSADTHLANLRIRPAELPGLAAYGTGTSVSVAGLVIEGVRRYGLYVDRGARMSGRELSVSGTRGDSTGRFGRGRVVQTASALDLTRLVVFENRELGAFASDEGTTLAFTDVVLRDTQAQQSGREFGRGLSVQLGATAAITRALISRNRDGGLFASNRDGGLFASDEGTSLTLTDVVVRETRPTESDGCWGPAPRNAPTSTKRRLSLRRDQYSKAVKRSAHHIEGSSPFGIVSATFNSLLIPEPGPSTTERAELNETIHRLIEATPEAEEVSSGALARRRTRLYAVRARPYTAAGIHPVKQG